MVEPRQWLRLETLTPELPNVPITSHILPALLHAEFLGTNMSFPHLKVSFQFIMLVLALLYDMDISLHQTLSVSLLKLKLLI